MTLYDLGAVSVYAYRVYTGDNTTPGTVVTGALVEAEALLEEGLRRKLPATERAEAMRIYSDGRVYPKAYPIQTATGYTIDGNSLVGATPDAFPFIGVFERIDVPRATVTYTGGFTAPSGGAPLPKTLEHALYDLTKALAQDAPALLVGVTSASVGDVSATRPTAGWGAAEAFVPGISKRIGSYRRWWA